MKCAICNTEYNPPQPRPDLCPECNYIIDQTLMEMEQEEDCDDDSHDV